MSGGLRRSCRGRVIDFELVEDDFAVWLRSRKLSEGYVDQMLSCLRRFGVKIKDPIDVTKVFSGLSRGQSHQRAKVSGYMNVSRNAMMSAITREKSGSGILFRRGAGKMKDTFCLYC